jgi:hypothetical protein
MNGRVQALVDVHRRGEEGGMVDVQDRGGGESRLLEQGAVVDLGSRA